MKKFGVGIQLYGLRNTMAEDFEGTLKAVADLGYEYVEFAGYYNKSAEEIKALLEKYNLKCVSVHQGLDFYNDDPDAAAEFLKAFGVKYSVIPWYEKGKLAGSDAWEASAARFKAVAEVLKAHGMKLGYHNHDFEFETFEGKYLHDYIFEAVDEDKIFPEIDTCWVRYAGLSPEDKICQFAGRVPVVHLKDFTCNNLAGGPVYALIDNSGKEQEKDNKEENNFEFRPLGMGMQNFAKILEACEKSGTETVIVEQDRTYGGMTELEAAKIARDYLKNTFGI